MIQKERLIFGSLEDLVGNGLRQVQGELDCDPIGDGAEVLEASVSADSPFA